jgi:hypothetical protein
MKLRLTKYLYLVWLIVLFVLFARSFSQQPRNLKENVNQVLVHGGSLVVLPDTTFIVQMDTVLLIPSGTKYEIKEIPDTKSDAFYDSLRNRTDKRRLTKALYGALVKAPLKSQTDTVDFQKSEEVFLPYAEKKIARIRLKKIKILAGSVEDTLLLEESRFSGFLNTFHYETRDDIILNNLLFKEGEEINPYELADNERLLRALSFIEDAKILVIPHPDNQEMADIIVITKDRFPLGFSPTIVNQKNFRVEVFDKNLLGLGTELRYTFLYNGDEDATTGHDIKYNMTNIRGTFIRGFLNYASKFGEELIRINFEKGFITPQIKYAGALDFGRTTEFREEQQESETVKVPFRKNYLDFWLGRSFLIDGIESRQNFILSGRYRIDDFRDRPRVKADSNFTFHNNQFILGSIGYQKIKYLKSSLILAFGITEDIPEGYFLQVISGFEEEEFADKTYVGIGVGGAKVWQKFGYTVIKAGFGGFISREKFQEGILRVATNYFTPLLRIRKYRFRQLVLASWVYGINRLPGEVTYIKDDIRGQSSDQVVGTNKLILSLESVMFSPWDLYGFRFALYAFGDLGLLAGEDEKLFKNENFLGSFGIGVRIRNESLVFKTIRLRLAYFPRTPGEIRHWDIDLTSRDRTVFQPIGIGKPNLIGFE